MVSSRPAFGPVLYFRGATRDLWRVRALIGTRERSDPPILDVGGDRVAGVWLAERSATTLWRYDLELPRGREPRSHSYRVGPSEWQIAVPGEDCLRLAFTACNGREDVELDRPEDFPHRNCLWRDLAEVHRDAPFYLLLQGGDQFYADLVWRKVPALDALKRRRRFRERGHKPSEADLVPVRDYYFGGYLKLWTQPELAPILARVPSLMIWDDHDIFDGWGSHPQIWQDSPAYQAVFAAAREAFQIFQLGEAGDGAAAHWYGERSQHFGWCMRIGDVALVAPDLRSTRTTCQVMSPEAWADFEAALASLEGCRSLLVLSSVPLVNVELHTLERLLGVLPGQHAYHNDLRDQWQSYAHREEWARMLRLLLDFAEKNAASVVSLSGEIHLAALGRAWRDGAELRQLTSSGIVHPPQNQGIARSLDVLGRRRMRPDDGLFCEMLRIPGTGTRYLAERNWLELEARPEAAVRARWHAEHAGDLPWFDLGPQASLDAKASR